MSDTPLIEETWLSCDFSTHIGAVNAGNALVKRARQLERDLAAATKERDDNKEQWSRARELIEQEREWRIASLQSMEEWKKQAGDAEQDLANLRAQLSELQSATPQDHAQVIEAAAKVFSETIGSLEVLGTFYRHSPTWETCKIEDVLTEARKAHSALVSTILTTQPRKEGESPCPKLQAPTTLANSGSNAAHTSDPSGAAHLRFDPKNSLEEAVLKIAKERDEALQEAKRWRNVARSYDDSPSHRFLEEFKQLKNRSSLLDVENHTLVQKFNTLETRTVMLCQQATAMASRIFAEYERLDAAISEDEGRDRGSYWVASYKEFKDFLASLI